MIECPQLLVTYLYILGNDIILYKGKVIVNAPPHFIALAALDPLHVLNTAMEATADRKLHNTHTSVNVAYFDQIIHSANKETE